MSHTALRPTAGMASAAVPAIMILRRLMFIEKLLVDLDEALAACDE